MEESDGEDQFVRVSWNDPTISFSKIVFTDVRELYPCNADIKCEFVVMPDPETEEEESNGKGKVGIFKIGWSTGCADDCVVAVDVNLDQTISGHSQRVMFRGESLPQEETDGEESAYFQFCFINANQQVRGMSVPFKFSKPEDVVYVDEIENDVQLVQTQTTFLQEKLDNILMQNGCLSTENSQLQQLVEELKNEKAEIEKIVKDRDFIIIDLEKRILDLQFSNKAQMGQNENVVSSLRSTIIGLNMEKDDLNIKLAAVTANRDVYKERNRISEISYQKNNFLEKQKIANLEKSCSQSAINLQSVTEELITKQNMLNAMTASKDMAVTELQEQRDINTELKIEKEKLEKELIEFKQALETCIAEKLECQSKYSKFRTMRATLECYRRISENSKIKKEELEIQLAKAERSLNDCSAEKLACQSENKKLYSIILASETRNQTIQKKMAIVENEEISFLKDQVASLQNQIQMCAEEYKKKYIDWYKAAKKVDKLKECIHGSNRMGKSINSDATVDISSVDHLTFFSQMEEHSLKETLNDEQKAKIVAEMENQLQKFKTSNSPKLPRSNMAMEIDGNLRLNAVKLENDYENDFDELNSNSSHESQFFDLYDYYNPNDEQRPVAAPETAAAEPLPMNDECLILADNSQNEFDVEEGIFNVCPMCLQTFEKEIGFEFFEQHVNEHF